MSTDTEVIEKKKTAIKEPKEPGKFKVVVLNDDVTPMEFVVAMLIGIFKFEEKQAVQLTLEIHNQGSAIAGIYPFEIAEQKVIDATTMARSNGFPLLMKVEAQ